MFVRHITTGLVATALLSTAAFAQTPASGGSSNSASASDVSFRGDWRTSKIVGLDVYNDSNESLGSISELLTDRSGNIKGAVIGVGGVLGVGEHLVAVAFDKLKFVSDPIVYAAGTNANANSNSVTSPATTSTMTTGAATGTASTSTTPGGMTSGSASASSTRADPWSPDHAVLNVTKDELKAMPEFKYTTGSAK